MGAVVVPGLTCCRCRKPFCKRLARPTVLGWRHAEDCSTLPAPVVLEGGRWVMAGGVSRWVEA